MRRRDPRTSGFQVEPLEGRLVLSTLAVTITPDSPTCFDLEAGAVVAPDAAGDAPSADLAFGAVAPSKGPDGPIYDVALGILGSQGSLYLAGTPYVSLDYATASALTLSTKTADPKSLAYDDTLLILTGDGHLFKVGNFTVATSATPTVSFDFDELKPSPQDMLTGLIDQVDSLPVQVQSVSGQLDAAFAALTAANASTRADATNHLNAFINAVTAQRGKKFGATDADALIASARGIIASIQS